MRGRKKIELRRKKLLLENGYFNGYQPFKKPLSPVLTSSARVRLGHDAEKEKNLPY